MQFNKGKSLWKSNTSLLQDKKFIEMIKKEITDYIEINNTGDINPSIIWERAKAVMRGRMIISYSSAKIKKG